MKEKLFSYLKYPIRALFIDLTPAEKSVFLTLLAHHNRVKGNDYDSEFYLSDRDLMTLSETSGKTVWNAKRKLAYHKIIKYRKGANNRTWYTLLPDEQLDLFEDKK